MRNPDVRPPLPAHLTPAEREFFFELRRLVDIAGLSIRALQDATSSNKSESTESSFYSKSQWGRWLNCQSSPPRKAVQKLARRLAVEDIEAEHLVELWALAFAPTRYPQEPGGVLVRPRQLPIATQHFMGRKAELEALMSLTEEATISSGAMVIVIEGTAGVGKTTLANRVGHAVVDLFPDGQLYVSMGGLGDGDDSMPVSQALRGFLEAFGMPAGQIPSSVNDQAALYRSLLAGRRILVVIDNVRDANQVRRLLPGSPGCLALVTSRNQLAGLAAEGAHVLRLNPFTMGEARDMLEQRLGSTRVRREPLAADELVRLCARLPLALSVAAAYAAAHPDFSFEVLTRELRSRRLDILDTGDPATTARTMFSASYHHLSDGAARMFRLLSVCAEPDTSLSAIAGLAAVPVDQARKTLDELVRAYLVEEHLPGRFASHELLRAYAAEQARANEAASELNAARGRLDHHLRTATPSPKPRYQEHFDDWYTDRAAAPAADAIIARHMRFPEHLFPGMIPAEGIPELIEELRLRAGDVLLDLGCGRGSYGLEIAARTGARLIGVDFSEVALSEARAQARRLGQEADFRLAEITATSLPTSAISAVLCADSIGFPEDTAAAYHEIRRVLVPGGRAVVTGWEARDHDDPRLPSQARRMNVGAGLREAGLVDVKVHDRPFWYACEHAIWEDSVVLASESPAALADLRDEAQWALQYFELRRRVMATATSP